MKGLQSKGERELGWFTPQIPAAPGAGPGQSRTLDLPPLPFPGCGLGAGWEVEPWGLEPVTPWDAGCRQGLSPQPHPGDLLTSGFCLAGVGVSTSPRSCRSRTQRGTSCSQRSSSRRSGKVRGVPGSGRREAGGGWARCMFLSPSPRKGDPGRGDEGGDEGRP